MVRGDFSARPRSERIFYPEFPGAAGKGRGGATAVVGPFGVAAAGSVIVASFFKGVARDRQKSSASWSGEHADEVYWVGRDLRRMRSR